MKELERILEQPGAAEQAKVVWLEMAPKVFEQARPERQKSYVDSSLKQVADIEGENSLTVTDFLTYTWVRSSVLHTQLLEGIVSKICVTLHAVRE